jgi:hypothetical protein
MFETKELKRSLLVGLVGAALGCGGGDGGSGGGGGGGTFDLGVPKDKPLVQLEDSELETVCTRIENTASSLFSQQQLHDFACTFEGFAASLTADANGNFQIDRQACMQEKNTCLSMPYDPEDSPFEDLQDEFAEECNPTQLRSQLADCNATVAEYEACLNAGLNLMRQMLSSFDCDRFNPQDLDNLMDFDPDALPACQTLAQKCPGLGEDEGGGGGGGGEGCTNTCVDRDDGFCDDGGPGSHTSICALGTDCNDCGPR